MVKSQSPAYLSEQTIVQHTGNRVFMAAGPPLLLHGLQQEKQAVEGKQEKLTLLVEEQEGVRVLLRLWEDTGQTVNTQLTRYIPQTQDLESAEKKLLKTTSIKKQLLSQLHYHKYRTNTIIAKKTGNSSSSAT